MKAACKSRYGTEEVLDVREADRPDPGPGELLVKVHATTVNRTDCAILTAKPLIMRFFTGFTRPRRLIPGTDFAGVVMQTGKDVNAFKPGDRVWGFNDSEISTQAEFAVIRTGSHIDHMPASLSFSQAAACIEGAHYARNFMNKVRVEPGQKVLVNGGTGAIGSALIQMLKDKGVQVTATCRGIHRELVRSIGADRTIDYLKDDFTRDSEVHDYVFDAVGKSTFGKCRRILKKNGVYISSELGPFVQNPMLALITPLTGGRKVGFPFPLDVLESLRYVKTLIDKGAFRPVIDREYVLDEVASAYAYVLSGEKVGNVVLKIHEES